jgi:hypothetical protein
MTSVLHDAGIGLDRGYLVDRRHRAGPTGGDAGAPMVQGEVRALTAISTSVSAAVPLLDGQNSSSWTPSTRATAR